MPTTNPATETVSGPQQATQVHLPSLIEALSVQPEHGLIKTIVEQFVTERHAYFFASGKRPQGDRGLMEPSFHVSTLLQALSWERLDQTEGRNLTRHELVAMRDEVLDSLEARELGQRLLVALGWRQTAPTDPYDMTLARQLVWSALILELDPPEQRKLGTVAGYDLMAAKNWGETYPQIRDQFVNDQQWRTRTVEGHRSSEAARLALCILTPVMADFAVEDVPADLRYGTLAWANFAHGVTLAEALHPGSVAQMTFKALIELPIELCDGASQDELQLIATTRLMPALQWALAQGVLTAPPSLEFSADDQRKALAALDDESRQAAASVQALLAESPDRLKMARQKLEELYPKSMAAVMSDMRMYLSTLGKRFEYALRHPSPRIPLGKYPLLDVFAAGYMKEGTDKFKPMLKDYPEEARGDIPELLAKLEGIDIPALYDQAFSNYRQRAISGYSVLIRSLMSQLPAQDRIALSNGQVKVYALQKETGLNQEDETHSSREQHRGRFGFVIQCHDNALQFSYEVFPLSGQLRYRTDLPQPLQHHRIEQRPGGSHNLKRVGYRLPLDWEAYKKGTEAKTDVFSAVLCVELCHFAAVPTADRQTAPLLCSSRFHTLAERVAHRHLFFDHASAYEHYRHTTLVEYTAQNYPPVFRSLEILIPGLSCFNAIQNNELPIASCVADIGSVLGLPALRLMRGSVKVTMIAGRVGLAKTLPAYGRLSSSFLASSAASYRAALHPLGLTELGTSIFNGFFKASKASVTAAGRLAARMSRLVKINANTRFFRLPQRINGRVGYPLSGRGPATSGTPIGLGTRVNNATELDDFLKRDNIFAGRDQVRADMRAEIVDGQEVRIFVRKDYSRTLVRKDSDGKSYIDLSNNSAITLEGHYDYRTLRSWAVADEANKPAIVRVPPAQISPGRDSLDTARLASVQQAIENGTYLPPIDVNKTHNGYSIINGNHRLQAAKNLNLDNVPVLVDKAPGLALTPHVPVASVQTGTITTMTQTTAATNTVTQTK
ncbi:MAG: ParB/RepB/Spo0J family partition protein [Pseudomonas sp.]